MQAGRLQSIMEWLSDGARSTPEVGRFMAESCELHVGQMLHGNIGGGRRLDFTCIGPAVNLAARLEKIAGTLNRTVVASPVFASAFPKVGPISASFRSWAFAAPSGSMVWPMKTRCERSRDVAMDVILRQPMPWHQGQRRDSRRVAADVCAMVS